MKSIFWTGYSNNDRIIAISEIERIVNNYGCITDFKQFSDISICINIEISESNIDKLYDMLSGYIGLNDFEKLNSASDNECLILLNITFSKGTGNLRIETPAVPG